MGAVSYRGALVCFKKPRGIYLLDTSSPFIGAWSVNQVARNIGVAGTRAYAQVENDILFVDNNADFRALSAVQEFGDVGTRSISDLSFLNDFIRNNFSIPNINRWTAVYYPSKRQVHVAVTESTNLNNQRIVIDLNKPGVFNFSILDFIVSQSRSTAPSWDLVD